MITIRSAISLLISTLLFAAMPTNAAETRLELKLPSTKAEVFERVEIAVAGLPATTNPFDPQSITLDLEVTPPSGKTVRVPGFFSRDYTRKLEGNREVLTEQGEGGWLVRWLPLEPGRHQLVVTTAAGGAPAAKAEAYMDVAKGKRSGLVRVEPGQKRYFQMDDGTPLFLNGLCVCWHGSRGTYDYEDWLAACQKAGINYIRIWMWHQAFGLEWDRQDKVRYRMDNAWRLDRVLAEAERRGIYVMLCFDYHGIFEVKPDFGAATITGRGTLTTRPTAAPARCRTISSPTPRPGNSTKSGCVTWWRGGRRSRTSWRGSSLTKSTTSTPT